MQLIIIKNVIYKYSRTITYFPLHSINFHCLNKQQALILVSIIGGEGMGVGKKLILIY